MSEDDIECNRCGGCLIERDHARSGCPGPWTIDTLRTRLATVEKEREELAAERESYSHVLRERRDLQFDRDRLTAERDAARANAEDFNRQRVNYARLWETATAERDAARAECERLRGERDDLLEGRTLATRGIDIVYGKLKPEIEKQTAEAIAAFIDAEAETRREEGFSYRAVSELAADIRSGKWKETK